MTVKINTEPSKNLYQGALKTNFNPFASLRCTNLLLQTQFNMVFPSAELPVLRQYHVVNTS